MWGSLLKFRREFDQYINLRPVKLFDGVPCPLANKKPGDIDMLIVRENTEGEYSTVGGRMYKDTDREIAIQETIMSSHGVDRVQKYAFELAKSKGRKKVTNATKSNGISITMPFWDERFNKINFLCPVDKLSNKKTFFFFVKRTSVMWDPMYPAPPVISIFFTIILGYIKQLLS